MWMEGSSDGLGNGGWKEVLCDLFNFIVDKHY